MSVQFHDLAGQARDLLECAAVALVAGCPEQGARHPLLDFNRIHGLSVVGAAGTSGAAALLENERIRAACDLSVQAGQWYSPKRAGGAWCSLAVNPLERPSGVLGLLVCVDTREQAFGVGERQLLRQLAPQIARQLERRYASDEFAERSAGYVDASARAENSGPRSPDHGRKLSDDARPQYEFISMVSHELRRPLTAIKGYATLLQAYGGQSEAGEANGRGVMDPLLQHDYIDHIIEQAGHLEVLVSDLLDASRIEAGRLALHTVPVNAAALCQRATQVMRDQAERQYPGRYLLRCYATPELPRISADTDRLWQTLTNLIDNAIKYSPDGGTIEVCAEILTAAPEMRPGDTDQCVSPTHRQWVGISVRDEGMGIPPEQQARLFQPFSRLHDAERRQIAGNGIGLYLAHRLVEAMGGTIEIVSSPGEGTQVRMKFPARDENIFD